MDNVIADSTRIDMVQRALMTIAHVMTMAAQEKT